MRTLTAVLGCIVLMSAPARAVFLNVANSDFETNGVTDGIFTNSPGVTPTDWTLETGGGAVGSFFGYWNPQNSAYANTTGSPGVNGSMLGPNVFYFGSLETNQGLSQTISGATFEAGTDYTLTVAMGTRLDFAVMGDMRMSLYAGSTEIASTVILASNYATALTAGTFADQSLTYIYSSADGDLDGQALTISFIAMDNGKELDIDNVRLEAIPEPATAGLAALSAIVLCFRPRRRAQLA